MFLIFEVFYEKFHVFENNLLRLQENYVTFQKNTHYSKKWKVFFQKFLNLLIPPRKYLLFSKLFFEKLIEISHAIVEQV